MAGSPLVKADDLFIAKMLSMRNEISIDKINYPAKIYN
jgi:hypothetical protein